MNEKLAGEEERCQEGNLESVVGASQGALRMGNADGSKERRETKDLTSPVQQDEGREADAEATDDGLP